MQGRSRGRAAAGRRVGAAWLLIFAVGCAALGGPPPVPLLGDSGLAWIVIQVKGME